MLELLRYVEFEGYRLAIWDTNRTSSAVGSGQTHWQIAHALWHPDGTLLFHGSDIGVPMLAGNAIDSDVTVRNVVGWLTLQPGDTDEDFFDSYTPKQLEWAESECELLSMWAGDDDEIREHYQFTEIDRP